MLDTMTFTKVAGALCGALLVLLLAKWAAEELYHMDSHGQQAYVIDTGEEDGAGGAEEVVVQASFEELLASADVGKGARVFNKCRACHQLEDGANATGPHLYGVVGRPKAAVDGFGYSATLASMEGDWSPENLSGFLENPREYAPGTTMSFSGLRDMEERANLIAYLDTIGE